MDKALAGFPFTKAGVEMARWDGLAKSLGTSVNTLLGSHSELGPVEVSISGTPPERAGDIARSAWEAGFRKFKVKVGTGLAKDLKRVAAIRTALGDEVSLAVDVNGGWTLSEARTAFQPLAEMKIAAIEQRLPPGSLPGIAAGKDFEWQRSVSCLPQDGRSKARGQATGIVGSLAGASGSQNVQSPVG